MSEYVLEDATYEKVMNLIEEQMNLGLNPASNAEADLKMFPTYVRSLPNGTGIKKNPF